MVAPMLPQNNTQAAPGGGDGHKYLARVWIPGQGYHYTYGPGHNIRAPNMMQRIKDLAAKQQAPPTAPTPTPLTPPPDTGQGLESAGPTRGSDNRDAPSSGQEPLDADQSASQTAERTLDRRPGSRGRDFFAPGDGDPSPDTDRFVRHARAAVRAALLLYLHERCVGAPLTTVWQAVEPHLDRALDAGVTAALADRSLIHALFRGARGNETSAAHLLAAARWPQAATAICAAAGAPQLAGELAHIARPRGGFPAFDAAQRTLSNMRDQGTIA